MPNLNTSRGTAKLTAKGQCTIPKTVRDELGLKPGDDIDFFKDSDGRIVLQRVFDRARLEKWVGYAKHLKGVDVDELINEMRGR